MIAVTLVEQREPLAPLLDEEHVIVNEVVVAKDRGWTCRARRGALEGAEPIEQSPLHPERVPPQIRQEHVADRAEQRA